MLPENRRSLTNGSLGGPGLCDGREFGGVVMGDISHWPGSGARMSLGLAPLATAISGADGSLPTGLETEVDLDGGR
jgi:hypothetical protein